MIRLSARQLLALEIFFWVAFAACYVIFPDRLYLLTQILIADLFAASLDIALGYAGILTLGHAVFFGLGAYGTGILAKAGWGEPIRRVQKVGDHYGNVEFKTIEPTR